MRLQVLFAVLVVGGLSACGEPEDSSEGCDGEPLGSTRCDGELQQSCIERNGKPQWSLSVPCPGEESCGEGSCPWVDCEKEGELRCQEEGKALERCIDGSWMVEPCTAGCRGGAMGTFCPPEEDLVELQGTFKYAARDFDPDDRSGWQVAGDRAGGGFLVVVGQIQEGGVPVYYDVSTTSESPSELGRFSVKVPAKPRPGDELRVYSQLHTPEGKLLYAVGSPGHPEGMRSASERPSKGARVWSWSWPLEELGADSEVVVSEKDGAAAAGFFAEMVKNLRFSGQFHKLEESSLVGWVSEGVSWDCGICFVASPVKAFDASFASQLFLDGGVDQNYWSRAAIHHEMGHWVMASYATPIMESGVHFTGMLSFPGMAWAEGFATWHSAQVRGETQLWSRIGSRFTWWDIGTREYLEAQKPWVKPTASHEDGVMQRMDENEVAAMLWELAGSSPDALSRMHAAIASPALKGPVFGRGYVLVKWDFDQSGNMTDIVSTGVQGPTFADYLDVLTCSGFPSDVLERVLQPETIFPYSLDEPICQ